MSETTEAIPSGADMATVLDRMNRASNFASNGKFFIEHAEDQIKTARTYISATQAMLDEASAALDALVQGKDD